MAKKIKVLHLASLINRNDFVDSLVSSFNTGVFDISVATFTDKANIMEPGYAERGIKHHVLNIRGRKQYIAATRKILSILKREKIDILHTHMFDEAFLGAIIKLVYPKIQFVLGRHYSDEIYLTATGWRRKRSLAVENFANRMADRIIAVSSFIETLLKKQRVPPGKIFRANYGFDFTQPKYQPPNAEESRKLRYDLHLEHNFICLNVGRHYFLKRQDLLILAFESIAKDHADARLLLVGDGPWNSFLKEMVAERKLEEKVLFLGWRKDVSQLIGMADVVVQPTMTEAFPQIMVETMAIGTPLIISNVSGSCDQVHHLKTGYLVTPGDLEQLKEALLFVHHNPALIKEMAGNGKAYVQNNLSISDVIKDYEKLYKSLLKKYPN